MRVTQNEQVLDYLDRNGSITPLEALKKFDCMRLGARIYDLKRRGHDIRMTLESRTNENGQKRYARYWLMKKPDAKDEQGRDRA